MLCRIQKNPPEKVHVQTPAGALTGGAWRAGPRADGLLVGARGAGLYAAMAQRGAAPRLVILTVGRRAPPRARPGRHIQTSADGHAAGLRAC
jgi:hypothetical protein